MYNKKVIIDAIRNLNKSKPATKYNKAYTNNTTGKKKSDNVISAENGVNAPVFKSLSVGPSKIQGKGIFSQEPIAKDDVIGVSHIRKSFTKNGEQYQAPFPSVELGGYYNHSESPNIYEVDNGDHILMLAKRNINPGEELTSNYYNHNIKDLESPDNFKKGGSAKRPKIPNKKNSKAYSRSFEATNKFFAQNPLFSKPKSRKNKIFDPNAKYYADGGELIKAQNGLSHKERMQAYDDSLAVYNMYQEERNYFNKLFGNYKPKLLSDKDVRRLDKWFNYYNNHNVPKDAIQRLKDLNKRKPYDKTPQRVYDKNTLKNGKYNVDKFVGNFPKPKKPIDSKAPSKVTKTQSSKVNQSPCSNPITTVVNNVPEKAPFGKKLVGTNSETLPVTGKKCEYVKTINPIYEDLKVEPIELGRFPERIDNGPLPSLQVNDYSLPDSIEAPQYTLDPYTDDRLRLSVTPGKSRRVTKSERLSGGQRYKHTEYKPTKDLKFGKKEVTKPIASLVQKLTGYDPAYFEGYEDEEGNFVPGELDYGNATGSEMEFRGAASLRDLINQQKYKKEYEEYDKKLDTWLEQYEQSKKKQAEGRAFKYGGLSKFLDGGPQCPDGYTYNPETKRCEGQRKDCPEGYDWDEQEGRCKSKAYREKSELYVKGNKVVPTEEQEKYPWWPDDLTIKNLEPRYNLIQPEKRLSIFKPGLSDTKYEWSPVEVEIYPDLNYQVVVDPNKPKGYNADKSIYYVPDENNFEFEKFKQYKKLKEIEKENLANLEKYPNLTTKTESGYNWEDAYLNPEYMPFSNKNKTFDEYKNIKKEEYEGCTDCTYGHGETISYDDDDRITEQNLAHVYNKFYDIPDYDTRFEREHDYIELSNDSVIPRLDLASSDVEAPTYAEGDPSMMMPHVRLDAGKTKSKKHSGRLIDGKGQRYKHTTYKQGKDLEFGKHEVNRLIPALVQKFTGYDPKYYQGYDKEVGDETEYVPGEIERAEQEGRKINFKGAATLRDLKKQKEYDRQWLEYQNQKDAVRQQNEAYLQEYDITPEEYEQYYGPFKNGGAKKKDLPKASYGLTGLGKDRALTFTPFDFRTAYGQVGDFNVNPNYSLSYTTPDLFKKMNVSGNPLTFTIGRPYKTDAQSLTNPTRSFMGEYSLPYNDPAMAGPNPQYDAFLQDVSDYTNTPLSQLSTTQVNQYNAAKNLEGAKQIYKKGIPLTANIGYDIYGNAFGDSSSGPFTGALGFNAGYAPESGLYGSFDTSIMGVFGKRKNNATIRPNRYFDKGLTRQGDMAFIPKLNILNFIMKQRPEYNDEQTQKILDLYAQDIQQGTTTADEFLQNQSDQADRYDISFLSPELTFQAKPFKKIPGVLSATAGLRLDYEGKADRAQNSIPITPNPYGNIRYTVPVEGAIDKLKDLNLPSIKRKKTYEDYANDQEYDKEYTDDEYTRDVTDNNSIETDNQINPPQIQLNPNGTVIGRGDCPEGYERPCEKCRCQKIKMPQSYIDKRGKQLFGNEPITFKDGGERKKRKTRWKNVTDESFPQTTRTPIDSEYLEEYPDFQPYMLNMPEVALRPRKQPTFLRRTEDTINEWLGYPMDRAAREAAQRGGKEDPVDNFRHPMAGYYTAQKIGPLGANALGILHEISTLSNPRDTRPWYNKLRESAEDIYNNNEGASLSFLPESWAKSIIGFESDNNLIPDGVSNPRGKNMYFKEDGGDIQLKLTQKEIDEYVKGGYIVEDISVPSLSNKTDIPKARFGWITKEKKVPKEPVKVDPVQDMITKISGENLGQLMDKENYDVINTLKDKEIISQTLNPMTLMTYPNLLDLATRRGIQDALTFMRSTEAKDYGISTSGTKTDLAPRDLDAIVKYDLENDKVGQALYAATHIPNTRYGQRSGLSSLPYKNEYVNVFRYGEGPTDYVVANDQMTAAERVKLKTGKYPSYLKQDYLKQGTPDSLDALYTFANRNTPYVKAIKEGTFSDLYGPYKSIVRYPFDYSGSASDMLQRFVDLENYTSDNSKTVDKTSGKEGAKSGDIITDSLIDKNSRGTYQSLQGPETAVIGNPGQKVFDPVATYYKPGHLELETEKENVYNLLENNTNEEIIDYVNDKIKKGEFSDPQTNINLLKEDPEFAQIKSSDEYSPSVYINYWVDPKTGLVNKNMDKKAAAQSAAQSYLGYLEHIKEPMVMKNTSDVIKIPYSPFRFKFEDGGEYQLGDEVDKLTKEKLEKLGYTFEIVK